VEGFAEKGTPADWDMALGTVRGYRCWTMSLPLVTPQSGLFNRYYQYPPGWGNNGTFIASHLPQLDKAYVEGMYGGRWSHKHKLQGWYTARCSGYAGSYSHLVPDRSVAAHRPPDPDCGCGYWAYWNTWDSTEFRHQRPWVKYTAYKGYEVIIPLSGVIEGSGATIIGEKGFRSERARITDLSMPIFDSCVYEESSVGYTADDFKWGPPGTPSIPMYTYGGLGPSRQVEPVVKFLAREIEVPEKLVLETILTAVTLCLGQVKMHTTPEALAAVCLPDPNYGV